ncbi:hypothetical protein NECAME_09873 [Necator americanus]|uniref:Uncharacterized protein n=1 Tax=Necator americanus TaxID=51031 RepID=W2TBG8_NECAM|nr:hypothetical protein NECAME_09873 [Necator americanus]ETN79375.1 hypothetical protein NECAME_09873 [Necator americanus]
MFGFHTSKPPLQPRLLLNVQRQRYLAIPFGIAKKSIYRIGITSYEPTSDLYNRGVSERECFSSQSNSGDIDTGGGFYVFTVEPFLSSADHNLLFTCSYYVPREFKHSVFERQEK